MIYQPADGQLAALPATITVSMLPKGSPALLGPAGIQAMLRRMSIEISTLQEKNAALAGQANAAQSSAAQAQKPDLGAAVAEWAQANGFSAADANKQVQQWAEGIQKQSGEATAEQKALAELALNHYANAAQLFNEAGDADRRQIDTEEAQEKALQAQMQALQAAQQALLEKLRTPMRELLDHSQQAAGAYRLNGQYHEATQTLESAATAIDAQSNKFPDDKGFHELWLEAFGAAASARSREGTVAPARESLALLEQSASDYRSLVSKYAVLGDRQEEAGAQVGLGIVLEEEGVRVSGDKSAALLEQAVQAFREALEVRTKADLPKDWASTQDDLGVVLNDEAVRTSGDKTAGLLDQAVEAFRSALTVYTKADQPQDWARTQRSLGTALEGEGDDATTGDKAAVLLDQAVQAYRSALEVDTRADQPQEWARIEVVLGYALDDEGERASGDKAVGLFDQAVQAYRSALEVYTQAGQPQAWANAQIGLGDVLLREGERTSGDKSIGLFEQSVQAFRSALEVFTQADLPQSWASTQNVLGNALWEEW